MVKRSSDAVYAKYPSIEVGEGTVVEPGAVLGVPPRGVKPGQLATRIGAGGHIRSGTVIYAGVTIGSGINIGHGAMIREDNVVGDDCSIGTHAVLEPGNRVGHGTRIHSQCFLEHVSLGSGVFVGPGVVFADDPHPICPRYLECVLGATVEDDASIGANSTILPGVRIGARALVGAGSTVTHDVAADTVVAGNPANYRRAVEELTCHRGLFERPYVWRMPRTSS